jgi:ribosomal protein S27AE
MAREWEYKVLRRVDAVKSEKWLNLANGGSEFYNTEVSNETKQKMSIYHQNRSETHKQNLEKNRKGGFDCLSEEDLRSLIEKRKDSPKWWGDEHRRKITEHNRQKALDPEWRKKQSENAKRFYNEKNGEKTIEERIYPDSGYGKMKSESHRNAISESQKGKKHPTKTCDYCGKTISASNHKRWHGGKCKENNL